METLLSLTSKRAGEWFKEELRELGGVEHLIRTITHCTQMFTPDLETWTHPLLEKLSKVDRCLKVIENVGVLEILSGLFVCFCLFFKYLDFTCQARSLSVFVFSGTGDAPKHSQSRVPPDVPRRHIPRETHVPVSAVSCRGAPVPSQ